MNDENDFDLKKFNNEFDKAISKKENTKRIDEKNYKIEKKKIYELSLKEILINLKNNIFDVFYEIFTLKFSSFDEFILIFTKNDRLFYIGTFLILCSIIFYILYIIFYDDLKKESNVYNTYNTYNNNDSIPLKYVTSLNFFFI